MLLDANALLKCMSPEWATYTTNTSTSPTASTADGTNAFLLNAIALYERRTPGTGAGRTP
jgi:hypothetical protein